jgi:hypothetical protein
VRRSAARQTASQDSFHNVVDIVGDATDRNPTALPIARLKVNRARRAVL